jgi:hypothetical protein
MRSNISCAWARPSVRIRPRTSTLSCQEAVPCPSGSSARRPPVEVFGGHHHSLQKRYKVTGVAAIPEWDAYRVVSCGHGGGLVNIRVGQPDGYQRSTTSVAWNRWDAHGGRVPTVRVERDHADACLSGSRRASRSPPARCDRRHQQLSVAV